mmetsp:Transcript_20025/g.34459  ORF Transcript_20025/g.34459 Transcript_20025/m.34459 type:complete len:299 (+) Transcript_20025:725-1621(+)
MELADACRVTSVVIIRVQLNIVSHRIARVHGQNTIGMDPLVLDDIVHHLLSIVEELLRLLTHRGIVEDLRVASVGILASQLPGLEKRIPVNVRHQLFQRIIDQLGHTQNARLGSRRVLNKVNSEMLLTCRVNSKRFALLLTSIVLFSKLLILIGNILDIIVTSSALVQQARNDCDRSTGVQHVDHWRFVSRSKLDCSVHLGSGGTADQAWNREAVLLQLGYDIDHFIQRRGNQTGKTHNIRLVLDARLQNLVGRTHNTQVDDSIIVAAQHDGHNILSNVVHIALDRRNHKGTVVHVFW